MEALHLQQQSGRIVIDVVIIWHSLTTPKKAMALHFAGKEEVTDLSRHISFWRNMLIKFCHFDCLLTFCTWSEDARGWGLPTKRCQIWLFHHLLKKWNIPHYITYLPLQGQGHSYEHTRSSVCSFYHSIAHQSHEYPDMLQDKTDYSLCSYDQRVLFSIASSSAFLHWMMLSPKGYLLIYYNPVYSFVVIYRSRYIRRIIRRL